MAAVQRPIATPVGTETTLRVTARMRLIPTRLALSRHHPYDSLEGPRGATLGTFTNAGMGSPRRPWLWARMLPWPSL